MKDSEFPQAPRNILMRRRKLVEGNKNEGFQNSAGTSEYPQAAEEIDWG